MDLQNVLATTSTLPFEWVAIIGFALIVAVDIVTYGARKECALALALPLAAFLSGLISQSAFLDGVVTQYAATPYASTGIFLGLTILSVLLVYRIGLSEGIESGQPLLAALGGVALTAIVLTIWTHEPMLQALWHFGPHVQTIFADQYRFFWLAGGYLVLAFVRS